MMRTLQPPSKLACRKSLSVLLLLGVFSPSLAQGQIANAVGVTVELAPSSDLDVDNLDASIDGSRPTLGYQNVRATLLLPVELETLDSLLIPGVSYRLYRPQLDERILVEGPNTLHDVTLQLGVLHDLDDIWSLLLIASAGLATDFEDLESDHVRYQGVGLVRYAYGSSWIFGLGAAFSYWFGEPLTVPMVQVVYNGDRWNADINLPRLAMIRYTLVEGMDVGLLGQLDGNRFSVGEDLPVESVSLLLADAGINFGLNLSGPVWLELYGGVTFLRQYQYLDEQNTELVNLDQEPGPIFRVGLQIRPKRKSAF